MIIVFVGVSPIRKDLRDQRPLAYPGRLVGPMATSLTQDGDSQSWLWKDSTVARSRRTDDAKQLPTRSMLQIESIGDTASCLVVNLYCPTIF